MTRTALACAITLFTTSLPGPTLAAPLVEQYVSPVSDLDGHRYVIYSAGDFENPVLWSDARDAAASAGGYLATITAASEEAFVQGTFAGSAIGVGVTTWIGLSDAADEGTFRWVTSPEAGQLLSYSDWRTGEPNNNGPTGNEDYVTWANYPDGPSGGAWNDIAEGEKVWQLMVEFEPVLEWVSGTNPDNGHTYAIYRAAASRIRLAGSAPGMLPACWAVISRPLLPKPKRCFCKAHLPVAIFSKG